MMFILSKENSIANNFLVELRDVNIHSDRMRFRKNIERIGQILSYEISKDLDFEKVEIQTPLDKHSSDIIKNQPVISTVLRAGLPFYNGILSYFDKADSSFIGAMRANEGNAESIEIDLGYFASPSIKNRVLILCDPMLATGKSLVEAYKSLVKTHGEPKKVIVAAVIGSKQGVEFVKNNIPNSKLYIATIDEELNDQAYIVPGLGDAGDLCFGEKL